MITGVTIERARPGDVAAIVDVLRRAWLATYPDADAGVTVDDVRRRLDVVESGAGDDGRVLGSAARWREVIASTATTATRRVYVARADGDGDGDGVIGVVCADVASVDDVVDPAGRRRVVVLHVLPTAQGRGVGGRLLRTALAWHAAAGTAPVYVNVVDYNRAALRFYRRYGFRATGRVVDDATARRLGLRELPRLELVRPAGGSP